MNEFKQYVATYGLTPLANAMGVSVQRIGNWLERGVPIDQCANLEQTTCGAVRRWDLRPSDWHVIWPELVGAVGAPAVQRPNGEPQG